jgi:hypothetical protein
MAKKWETLRATISLERREANRLAAQPMMAEMPLEELRSARNITQTHLASLLQITQASVSKMEKRTDMDLALSRNFRPRNYPEGVSSGLSTKVSLTWSGR